MGMKGGRCSSHRGGSASRWLVGVVCLLLSSVQIQPSRAQANSANAIEEQALQQFKAENGINSNAMRSWQVGPGVNHCTAWKGVNCWSTGSVRWLRLPAAGLSGVMSMALGGLPRLSRLNLRDNALTGAIPPSLVVMTSLKKLTLQGNQLSGPIPDFLRNFTNLDELGLANNMFQGPFPTNMFATMRELQIVDMGNNRITGQIPDNLVDIPTLQSLSLRANNLSGPISPLLASSPSLVTVDLSQNSLVGPLPSVWTVSNLTFLDLSSNFLQGEIPPSLLSLGNLTLNLAGNNFSGKISQSVACSFGNAAFKNNPFLVVDLCASPSAAPALMPRASDDSAAAAPAPTKKKSSSSLSTLTIVALTAGDIALLLMSAAGFTFFYMWWKKRAKNAKFDGGKDAWSKEEKSSSSTLRSVYGKELGQAADPHRPTYLVAAPALRPALKACSGSMADPAKTSTEYLVASDPDAMGACAEKDSAVSCEEFGTDLVILDKFLVLEIEELLRANAMVLGAGTFGGVYMAVMEDGHMLAIKRLEEQALKNEHVFARQIRKLADVKHPNLLPIRAYCWSPTERLVICDYMPNGSLFSLLHGDKEQRPAILSWATRHKIALETARALAYLHDNDMVHGNVKATNVLLDDKFEVRVGDFGLESLLEAPLQHTSSAGYLAPELMTSSRRKSAKGDVYSFGVLLLELLTGLEPLGKNNMDLSTWVQEMVKSHRTEDVFDPSLVSSHVLPAQDVLELLDLAQACVAEQPNRRPTIEAVLRSLETIVPSGGFLPDPAVLPQQMGHDLSVEHGYDYGHEYVANIHMHTRGPRGAVDSLDLSPAHNHGGYYSDASSSSISPLQAGFPSSSGRAYD
ncbi:hypothetical protein MPTK2_1g19750 [Marchantia polymorpha subsp. ruderalis]